MTVSSDNPESIDANPPALPRREAAIVLITLFTLTALVWLYLLQSARDMTAMAAMPGMATQQQTWGVSDALYAFAMWSAMMAGMMLPGASPMVLLNAAIERKAQGRAGARTAVFVLGYLIVWTLFSAIATALQGALQQLRLLTDNGLTQATLGGAVLIVAGLYQWTALKTSCLERCRSPLAFLLQRWRPGMGGALRLGLTHGAYCLGCCWTLMLLLFVGGVMNLLWAAGLGALTLLEKLLPAGRLLARLFGVGLVVWGVWMFISAGTETVPALLEMRR
jgi:predicted metal-binding membrane protein